MPYNHRADLARNRLYVGISGFLEVREATESTSACLAAARRLRQGFDIITDIADAKPVNDDVAQLLGAAQLEIAKLKPRRVVRVVGKARIAALQMERTSRVAGYGTDVAATVEDAEKLLEKK
jgi:hypothetical protein